MRRALALMASGLVVTGAGLAGSSGTQSAAAATGTQPFKHLVVIYEENHSFDNLYGDWGPVNGQAVTGRPATGTQVDQAGHPIDCLYQNDANLGTVNQQFAWLDGTMHPGLRSAACTTTLANGSAVDSHFTSSDPFAINDYVTATDKTCAPGTAYMPNGVLSNDPQGLAGGCTRDLVHRFYQEQYQLDGGKMDRYPTGSDAAGMTQGYYDTKSLPIWQYLHGAAAPNYVLADHFFQAAFGGSFLNHQYLVAGRAPVWTDPVTGAAQHSKLDAAGFPNGGYPLYAADPATTYKDAALTQACPTDTPARDVSGYTVDAQGRACGDYAVNTVQPANYPSGSLNPDGTLKTGKTVLPLINDTDPSAPNYETNIGDELSAKGLTWAWYAGGWDDANAGHPDPLFQYHHQPFNYFANYAKGKPGRAHLKDENDFLDAVAFGTLPQVSFVKPIGSENEHPGYASTDNGESHLVDLIKSIEAGPEAADTLIVVTYDEFGGQWDHVAPPGQGNANGPSDSFGPGTRIPALVIGKPVQQSGVSTASYDTTSILKTIEDTWGLAPLGHRDATVNSLLGVLGAPASAPLSTTTTARASRAAVATGERFTIRGKVRHGDTVLAGHQVTLCQRASVMRPWRCTMTRQTTSQGYRFVLRGLRHAEQYRVKSPAQTVDGMQYAASHSPIVTVRHRR